MDCLPLLGGSGLEQILLIVKSHIDSAQTREEILLAVSTFKVNWNSFLFDLLIIYLAQCATYSALQGSWSMVVCVLFLPASKCQHWLQRPVPGCYLKRKRSCTERRSSYSNFTLTYVFFSTLVFPQGGIIQRSFLFIPVTCSPYPNAGHKRSSHSWLLCSHLGTVQVVPLVWCKIFPFAADEEVFEFLLLAVCSRVSFLPKGAEEVRSDNLGASLRCHLRSSSYRKRRNPGSSELSLPLSIHENCLSTRAGDSFVLWEELKTVSDWPKSLCSPASAKAGLEKFTVLL